jgi:Fe-Mn family superoxide dismutase
VLSAPHRGVLLAPVFETICKTQSKKSSNVSVKSSAKFPERSLPVRVSATLPEIHLTGAAMSAPFSLAPLPYDQAALEPVISARTLSFHYGKHHRTYVDTLNMLVVGTDYADMPLEKIVAATAKSQDAQQQKIFNSAAQVWSHDFHWCSLSPALVEPPAELAAAIARDFGDADALIAGLAEAGKAQFGSGWIWLVSRDGRLAIEKTGNAATPMSEGVNCLLTLDMWEHAYCLDYQNARQSYLQAILSRLINWRFAAENLEKESQPVRSAIA